MIVFYNQKFKINFFLTLILVFGGINLFSENSLQISFEGLSKIKYFPGIKTEFEEGGFGIEKSEIILAADISNVNTKVIFSSEKDVAKNNFIKFKEANIKINDLFDSSLDLTFFDIGYGAGKGNSIRPDLSVRGVQLDFHPSESLDLSLGYGLSRGEFYFYPISNGHIESSYSNDMDYSLIYHALKVDVAYNNYYVPIDFYYGILIAENTLYTDNAFLKNPIRDKIIHMSLGISLDFLASIRKEVMKLDIGLTLPFGPLSKAVFIDNQGDTTTEDEINFILQLYGDVSIYRGFGLEYYLHFTLDSHTKQETLGDLDEEYFKEVFKISFTPRYTYGPITYAQNFSLGYVGNRTATANTDKAGSINFLNSDAYTSVSIEPSIVWRPIPFDFNGNFFIKGYYQFDTGVLDLGFDNSHEIGLKVGIDFNSNLYD